MKTAVLHDRIPLGRIYGVPSFEEKLHQVAAGIAERTRLSAFEFADNGRRA